MQRTYTREMAKAVPGLLHGLGDATIDSLVNAAGLLADAWEILIPAAPVANTTYTVTVNGYAASFTTDAAPTQAELESGLFSAMRTSVEFTTAAEAVLDAPAHKINITARFVNTPLTVTASPGTLTVNHTSPTPPELGNIPFGRFVGRKPNYEVKQASLVNAITDQVLGITVSTHAVTQIETPFASTYNSPMMTEVGYKPLDVMNVMLRCSELTGIYTVVVPTEEIALTDTPYISVAPGTEGMVTKSATGTISIGDIAKFQRPSSVELGVNLVLLSFNQK